jgi:hypothetical protein
VAELTVMGVDDVEVLDDAEVLDAEVLDDAKVVASGIEIFDIMGLFVLKIGCDGKRQ